MTMTNDALREASFPHAVFGTLAERTRAREVTAYLRTIPQRVALKCDRDRVHPADLPELIGVSTADVATLADGRVLSAFQMLMVMHWLGDLGARGPADPVPAPPVGRHLRPAPNAPVPAGLSAATGHHRAAPTTTPQPGDAS